MFAGVLLFVIHYSLLRAWTGAAMNGIEAGIVYISYKKENSVRAKNRLWLYVFIGLYILAAALTVRKAVSLLPVLAQIAGAIAVWQKSPRTIRYIMLIPRPLWFTYNLAVGSHAGVVAEMFIFISVIAGIVRFDLLKRKTLPKAAK
jgi:hypothetical protein